MLRCGARGRAQDHLAMAAIRFLNTVAAGVHHGLFRSEGVLREVCERIVLPNLRLTPDLLEVFESNFVEYIRRDTEGSDFDTRRRAATELVRSLTAKFPQEVGGRPPCPSPLRSLSGQHLRSARPCNNHRHET